MRRAFELAFATCYSFAGSRPAFLLVDEISFQKPVDVSDLLRLKSSVLHVEHMYNPGPPWLKARNSHAVVHLEASCAARAPYSDLVVLFICLAKVSSLDMYVQVGSALHIHQQQ